MIYFFTNSCGYYSLKDVGVNEKGTSYVEMFCEKYGSNVGGHWGSGLTAYDTRKIIKHSVNGEGSLVVLHLGVVEAVTKSANGFLFNALTKLQQYGYTPEFELHMLPRMIKACKAIDEGRSEFFHMLDPDVFKETMNEIIKMLIGQRIIIVGLGKPVPAFTGQPECEPIERYNTILRDVANTHGIMFIDVWDRFPGMVYDNCHLTDQAHKLIFEAIDGYV